MKSKKPFRKKAQVKKTTDLYQGGLFSFTAEEVILPNGREAEMAIVRHPGSTAIVPLCEDGTLIMTLQYRHPVGDYLLEIPAGTMEPGESPEDCARRELEEETGLKAGKLIDLGQVYIIPSYSDEKIHLFLARSFTHTGARPDEDEIIQVVKYPFEEVLRMIDEGLVTDAVTILSIQAACRHMQGAS